MCPQKRTGKGGAELCPGGSIAKQTSRGIFSTKNYTAFLRRFLVLPAGVVVTGIFNIAPVVPKQAGGWGAGGGGSEVGMGQHLLLGVYL